MTFLNQAWAIKLKDYTPYKYEVLFTNPICKTYRYHRPVLNNNGDRISSKPKNVYCKSGDSSASKNKSNSPYKRLVQWIASPRTKKIFMAYLSFSNGGVGSALCKAMKKGVEVTLIIDNNNTSEASRMAQAKKLQRCGAKLHISGGSGRGRDKLGYAHNKVFIINPDSTSSMKIVFSSGNMSSGITTHHENWHFVTTSAKSYFAQAHICLMNGTLKYDQSISAYKSYMNSCRSKIKAPMEQDIKTYFIPADGSKATSIVSSGVRKAKAIDMAAHRFSYSKLISLLNSKLNNKGSQIRLITDDDLYWSGHYRKAMGRNTLQEWNKVDHLNKKGMQVKFMETYADDIWNPRSLQLHHNKFIVFHYGASNGAVFTGAGNLTGAAFTKNFENFYYITIPEVYKAYKAQYNFAWKNMATGINEMPRDLELP
jgi:phosphatidylserine/phosphatidylglycerophosphate/cardiolipin synthase-like enzyme